MPSPDHVPLFVIVTHALNIVFLLMLGRSGIEGGATGTSSPSSSGS